MNVDYRLLSTDPRSTVRSQVALMARPRAIDGLSRVAPYSCTVAEARGAAAGMKYEPHP